MSEYLIALINILRVFLSLLFNNFDCWNHRAGMLGRVTRVLAFTYCLPFNVHFIHAYQMRTILRLLRCCGAGGRRLDDFRHSAGDRMWK